MTRAAATHILNLPGAMLERGFWLYVWRVKTPKGEMLYVGRTGDNSSPHAVAPYTRMGQHLGFSDSQNALRTHLTRKEIDPGECSFELISHGPLFAEIDRSTGDRAEWMERHTPLRNKVGAMEKALADDLTDAGYAVLNRVKWNWKLDSEAWIPIREAFALHFPKLKNRRRGL
jgi:hypothetical protein